MKNLQKELAPRAIELKQLASGYTLQIKQAFSPWVSKLWDEKPQRYTRALLETLAIIGYRQPVTRSDIEEIRGVAVSSHIIRTLLEREWIKTLGHRDVPGKPAIFGTTKSFLDHFNLKSLSDLPSLQDIRDLDKAAEQLQAELELEVSTELETEDNVNQAVTEQTAEIDEEIIETENNLELDIVEERAETEEEMIAIDNNLELENPETAQEAEENLRLETIDE